MSTSPLTVSGTVSFRERITLPAGAIATVKLVDGDGEVLAGTAIEASSVPVEFTLRADPAFVADPDALFIWAALRSEAGTWGTTDLAPVAGTSAEVVLTKIDH